MRRRRGRHANCAWEVVAKSQFNLQLEKKERQSRSFFPHVFAVSAYLGTSRQDLREMVLAPVCGGTSVTLVLDTLVPSELVILMVVIFPLFRIFEPGDPGLAGVVDVAGVGGTAVVDETTVEPGGVTLSPVRNSACTLPAVKLIKLARLDSVLPRYSTLGVVALVLVEVKPVSTST